MRIGLNLQPLADQNLTGIGTYAREVGTRLAVMLESRGIDYDGHVFDFVGRHNAANQVTAHWGAGVPIHLRVCRLFPLGAYIRSGRLGALVSYQRLLRTSTSATVFFNYLRPYRVNGKTIITVYDMVSERYPETMDQRNRQLLKKYLAQSCRQADRIATISAFSKREIIACLGIPEEKIFVAPCGIDNDLFRPIIDPKERTKVSQFLRSSWGITEPYLLYLGTLEPRKNVITALTAFENVADEYPNLRFVLAGGKGWQFDETLKRIESSPYRSRIILTGYVSEHEKVYLYSMCTAFLFPSLYEGFGLPVAEAMSCGAPVVCSNAGSLPEITSDVAILCDPKDSSEFAHSIRSILDNPLLAEDKRQKGREMASQMTWDRAAAAYFEVLIENDGKRSDET